MKKIFALFGIVLTSILIFSFFNNKINAFELINNHMVTFDVDMDPVEVNGGYIIPECNVEAPEGEHFYCWGLNSWAGDRLFPGEEYEVSEDLELIAIFIPNDLVNVSDYSGGTLKTGEKIDVSKINVFGYNDYTSFGYYYENCEFYKGNPIDGLEDVDLSTVEFNEEGNFVYYVKVEEEKELIQLVINVDNSIKKITISYDNGDGTGSMASIVQSVDAVIIFPECEFKAPDGMQFAYWTIDLTEGQFTAGNTMYLLEDQMNIDTFVMYANYEVKPQTEFNVIFDPNGGTGYIPPVVMETGELELPLCTFKGPNNKPFLFWEIHATDPNTIDFAEEGTRLSPKNNITVDRDLTIIAIWNDEEASDITSISASYDGSIYEGNTIELNNLTINLLSSSKGTLTITGSDENLIYSIESKTININNYRFNERGFVELEITYQDVSCFITLTIIEKPANTVTYSYDSNGATGSMVGNSVEIGTEIVLKDCQFKPAKGYKFLCWSINQKKADQQTKKFPFEKITIEKNTIIYAQWIKELNISFDNGKGTGSMTPVSFIGLYTLPECEFKAPSFYHFAGWEIEGELHQPGEKIDVLGDVVLKATFEKDSSKKNNAGLIVFIVIMSVIVLGAGGFSIYWFVIKKKTFKDFTNLFNKNQKQKAKK